MKIREFLMKKYLNNLDMTICYLYNNIDVC